MKSIYFLIIQTLLFTETPNIRNVEDISVNFSAIYDYAIENNRNLEMILAVAYHENRFRNDTSGPICGPLQINHKYIDQNCEELNSADEFVPVGIAIYDQYSLYCNDKRKFKKREDLIGWCCYNSGNDCVSNRYINAILNYKSKIKYYREFYTKDYCGEK